MSTESIITLIFVAYKEEYFALIHKWNSDEKIREYVGYDKIPSEQDTREFMDVFSKSVNSIFSIIVTDRPIGYFVLSNINNDHGTAEFHITIGEPELLGKPICVEAMDEILTLCFDKLGLHRLTGILSSKNPKLIKASIKYGWTEEGIMKEMLNMNGKRFDYHILRMLKSEFRRRR